MNKGSSGKLLLVVLAVSVGVFAWTLLDWRKASRNSARAGEFFSEVSGTIQQIKVYRNVTGDAIKVVDERFNPNPIVRKCIAGSGLQIPSSFSISPTRLRRFGESDVREWKLVIPLLNGTTEQSDKFIRRLMDSEFSCQVTSIRATRFDDETRRTTEELWKFEFDIVYLVTEPE